MKTLSKNYKEIEFTFSGTIENAVNKLLRYKSEGVLACGDFNGTMLYSDNVTMDDAYKSIVGVTKAEFDESQRKWREDYNRREEEHKARIPELSKVWMKKGREILSENKWEYWDKIVPIRLGDLYQGMELGNSLDIIKILNDGGTLDEAKEKILDQGHSGMSFGLVCLLVRELCDRGEEFESYVRN